MRLSRLFPACALLLLASPAIGQSELAAPCARPDVPAAAREHCFTVAQALGSTQPQLGILIAGGNPTIGSASTGGLRLGLIPRVSAGVSANVVFIRLPDILAQSSGSAAQRLNDAVGIPAPALSGTVSVGVFGGFSAIPTVGGIGSVDLLGTATWLPFSVAEIEGVREGIADLSWGGGVRVGIVRESFLTPGVSVSLMHRRLGAISYGAVCPSAAVPTAWDDEGDYSYESGVCPTGGDPGEFTVDLSDWSARAVVGKRLLGIGAAAGIGYDRFSSDAGYGFRAQGTAASQPNYFRVTDLDVETGRWSAFANASLSLLVASLAAEVGWLQGDEPIEGFPSTSVFDPREGSFFGSVGLRLAL